MRNSYTAACIVKLLAEDMQVKSTERSVAKLRANYEAGAAQIHHEWPAWREFLS